LTGLLVTNALSFWLPRKVCLILNGKKMWDRTFFDGKFFFQFFKCVIPQSPDLQEFRWEIC
jgi:hypothetical protein